MRKIITSAFYSILLFIILVACLFSFLLTTTPGLYTSIRLGKMVLPGHLSIHQVKGRLLDEWSVEGLEYTIKNTQLRIQQLKIKWDLSSLRQFQLAIKQGQVDSLTLKIDNSEQVFKDIDFKGQVNAQDFQLDALHFNYLTHQIAAQFQAQSQTPYAFKGVIKINSTAKKPPIKANINLVGDNHQLRWTGAFSGLASGQFQGQLDNLHQGQAHLNLEPGRYQLPENDLLPALQYQGGHFKAELLPQGLKASGLINLDSDKRFTLNANLPGLDLTQGISANQPLTGELKLLIPSLDFLKQVSPELQNPQGELSASILAQGTLSKINYESLLLLKKGSLSLPLLGLNLSPIDFKVKAVGRLWEATGSVISGNKTLFIQGKGPIGPSFTGDLTLKGVDFPIANTREYQVQVSPTLQLKLTPSLLDITGTLLIPHAQIMPQTFTNSLTLPEEVVYKNKKTTQSSFMNTRVAINLSLGQDVRLTLKGLKALLNGTLKLEQQPQGPLNATGILSVTEGQYKAYGQDLGIEQGQLLFTGGRLDNPGVSLRASKKINSTASTLSSFDFNTRAQPQSNLSGPTTVGVEVTGRLTSPNIQLFSNPSVYSQADIMSLLVIGRPASQADNARGQLVIAALSSMSLGQDTNGAQIIEQLKQLSGLDLNVQTTTSYNPSTRQFSNNTALVISKMINKLFSIQVSSTTTSSGVDILYSKSKGHKQ